MTREHPQHADPVTYLGIDVGTSATKAVVIAPDGTVLARSRVPHPAARGAGPGRANPAAWKASITAAVRDLAPHTATVRGVGLDTHCPTALLLDAAGEPLTAGVTWDHPGLAEPTEQLIAALTPADQRLVGNHLMPATAMGAAHRLLQTIEPQAAAAAATFGFASTWLGHWLTGERAIDPTQASYTGLMASTDGSCRWLDDVLHRLGIPPQQLPPVRPSLSVLGALLPATADTLHLPHGIPVLVGSGDTPAASYALGTQPGGRPLLIMGTTHVVSNALDVPDHAGQSAATRRRPRRPMADQRRHQRRRRSRVRCAAPRLRPGRRGGGSDGRRGVHAPNPSRWQRAPVFIPHTRPERGPLWFAEPRTALLGAIPDPAAPSAARGVVEGVLFADRMIIESCIGAQQRTLYVSGAFGFEPELPQLLADALDRDILVVDESHLPAIGAAAMCAEVLDGQSRRAAAGPPCAAPPAMARHHHPTLAAVPPGLVRRHWTRLPLSTLDEVTSPQCRAQAAAKPRRKP